MRGIGKFSRWVRERTMEYTLGNWCSSTGLALAEARAMRSEKKYMRKLMPPAMARASSAPLVPPHNWPTPTNRAPRTAISTSVLKLLRMREMVGRGEGCPSAHEAAKTTQRALRVTPIGPALGRLESRQGRPPWRRLGGGDDSRRK